MGLHCASMQNAVLGALLTSLDTLRLQVDVVPCALVLHLVMDPRPHLGRRLRRRRLYRRQPARLQQVVQPGPAQGSLRRC